MSAIQNTGPENFTRASQPLKIAANLRLGTDVLDASKALEINLSQMRGDHLQHMVPQQQQCRWRSEYADFIAAYNATIKTEELPLDQWRTF